VLYPIELNKFYLETKGPRKTAKNDPTILLYSHKLVILAYPGKGSAEPKGPKTGQQKNRFLDTLV
jgi:hypothetical protein